MTLVGNVAVFCLGQDFYQDKAYLQCASRRIPVPYDSSVDIYNDGWQTTLDLISKQAAAMSAAR